MFDRQTPAEIAAQLADDGPVMTAFRWLEMVIHEDDFRAIWRGLDADFRLVIAQAWLWANRDHPDVVGYDLEGAGHVLASIDEQHDLRDAFASAQLGEFRAAWTFVDTTMLGGASRPRIVAPDYEAVILAPTEGVPIYADTPTEIADALRFLMHCSHGRWLVAGFQTDDIPNPTWPPRPPAAE